MEISSQDLKRLKAWRWSTFFVMLFGYVGYYMVRKNFSASFPLLKETFGYTNTQLGLIAASSELVYAMGKLINGPLGDKVGGKKIFLLGMAGAIVCNFLFAMGSSYIYFMIVWCTCRYFLSMGWGGIAKTIGAWYEPEKNGTVMGWISLNFQFGGAVATLFTGYLVSRGCSWDKLFLYPALVVSVVWIWAFFASKEKPTDVVPGTTFGQSDDEGSSSLAGFEETDGVKKIIFTLLKMPLFRYLLLYSFVTTLLRSIFFFWSAKFLYDIGLDATSSILKSAIFPFLGCFGTIMLGWYTDKFAVNGDRAKAMWIMLLGLVCSLVGIALFAESGALYQNLVVILLGASGFFLLGPYSMSSGCLTLDIAGSKGAGSCTGLIDGIGYIGGALASFGAGAISQQFGWSVVFWILSGFALLAVFSAFMMSLGFQKAYSEQGLVALSAKGTGELKESDL